MGERSLGAFCVFQEIEKLLWLCEENCLQDFVPEIFACNVGSGLGRFSIRCFCRIMHRCASFEVL